MPVYVDLRPLDRFESAFKAGMSGHGTSHIRRAIKQWGVIYRSAMKERFSRYSRGGGTWAKLRPSTIRQRRRGKGRRIVTKGAGRGKSQTRTVAKGTIAIMVDTGTLIGALDPVFQPGRGAAEVTIPFGIRVGFGGSARHEKGRGTIAMIAHTLHSGNRPHLKARPIIVAPDAATERRMASVMQKALGDEWKSATA